MRNPSRGGAGGTVVDGFGKSSTHPTRRSRGRTMRKTILTCALLATTGAAIAAEVTFDRLRNPEPQNWLMNHHDFGSQRFSTLATINKGNVKNLKLAFAVALGGNSGNENLCATPLVEDWFMY